MLGVGINVNQNSLPDVGRPAATLKNLGIPADKSALLNRVLTLFNARLKNALTQGFAAFAADYKIGFPIWAKPFLLLMAAKNFLAWPKTFLPRVLW